MVTRRRPRLLTPALFALLVAASCRTASPGATELLKLDARSPADAVALAEQTKDPARAAEIAWLEGNDRALAHRRLDAALTRHPHDPALLIRRMALRSAELDEDGSLEDLLAIIQHAPESPEADVALVTLADVLSDHFTKAATVAATIERSGLLGAGEAEPLKVVTASGIASRLASLARDEPRMQAAVARGGWLTRWTSIGPLGPRTQGALTEPTVHEATGIDPKRGDRFEGIEAPVRTRTAFRASVAPGSADRGGLYVMESFFSLREKRPLVLYVQMPEPGRVSIDGAKVFASALGGPRHAGWARVDLTLEAGWHRVAVAVLATSVTRPGISILGRDGRPALAEVSPTRPATALVATPPTVHPRSGALDAPESAEAWVDGLVVHGRGLFGSLVGAYISSTNLREDLDRAERLLTAAVGAAPTSAAILAADARLMIRTGLPRSLAEARLRDALARDANYPSVLVSLARSLGEDSPDAALGLLDRAEKAAPWAAAPHVARFRIYQSRGWNAEAARSLTEALARRETESLLLDGAGFWRGISRPEEADALEARLEAVSEPSPGVARANAALRTGDIEAAIAGLQEAAAKSVHPVVHLARIASIELGRGRVEAAEKAAEAALADDPLHAGAHHTLLLARLRAGDVEGARRELARMRALGAADVKLEALAADMGARAPLDAPGHSGWLASKLAIDPRAVVVGSRDTDLRWSRHKSVRLLERLVDEVRPDGSALSHRHTITRLLTKEATDEAGELNLPNDALPLALRTIKSDGRVVEVDRHAGKDDLSFSALAPGDAVEQSWVQVEEPETAFGGYARRFFFRHSIPLLRVEYAVIVPKTARVWFKAYNGAPEPERHEEGDRVTYLFSAREVPPVEPEPNATPWEEHLPFVFFTVDLDRDTALRANVVGLDALDQSSWRVRAKAEALTRGLNTEEEKVRAIHTFVSEEISHGKARDAAVALATRRGERTGLFLAMLHAIGVPADLVLARPGGAPRVTPEYPSPQEFAAMLVRVPLRAPGKYLWARMDLATPWLGKVTPDFRNGTYIVAREGDGVPKINAFDPSEVDTWGLVSSVDLSVDEKGTARGDLSIRLPGTYGAELRTFFRSARSEEVARALETWISSIIPGATLDNWAAEGVERALEPLIVKVSVVVPSFMVEDKAHLVAEQFFNAPVATRALGFPTLAAYLRVPRRTTPLYLAEQGEQMTVQITFPKGAGAPVEAPRTFRAEPTWGLFSQSFTWDAPTSTARLLVTQQISPMRIPVADFPAFRDTAQEILQSTRNRLIVPIRSGPAGREATASEE